MNGNYRQPVIVWAALIALTWITVISSRSLTGAAAAVPVLIAAVKASLVTGYFMRLRYEARAFFLVFGASAAVIAALILLLFSDVAYRR